MKSINGGEFTGERALFASHDLNIVGARFHSGESPLKESRNIDLTECEFGWKYPLWYCEDVSVYDTVFCEGARSGIWYTDNISLNNCVIDAPKQFRRSNGIKLEDVRFSNAQETMWNCSDIELSRVSVKGDYFGFGSSDILAEELDVDGNYIFDGAKNVTVRNSRLISKDAFWNCENVVVENCEIVGEYLGWNSKNVTFINCTIESNQGLCYIENLVMRGCKLINTDLCLEYCTVDAQIDSHIDSVKNPISGRIVARSIGQIIHEADKVDVTKTTIEEVKCNV